MKYIQAEGDPVDIIGLYSIHYKDELAGKCITLPRHEPVDTIYFCYFRNLNESTDCCRISMTEAKYLDSDFKLTRDELDLIIDTLKNDGIWERLVEAEIMFRVEEGISILWNLGKMPDYETLEVE